MLDPVLERACAADEQLREWAGVRLQQDKEARRPEIEAQRSEQQRQEQPEPSQALTLLLVPPI